MNTVAQLTAPQPQSPGARTLASQFLFSGRGPKCRVRIEALRSRGYYRGPTERLRAETLLRA